MDMNSTERHDVQAIAKPYLLFLGDITDPTDAKTALGILQWRPEWCAAQRRLAGCVVELGLPEMTAADAARHGIRRLVVGIAPDEGSCPHSGAQLLQALDAGLDLVAGLHTRLAESGIAQRAARSAAGDWTSAIRRARSHPAAVRSAAGVACSSRPDCAVGRNTPYWRSSAGSGPAVFRQIPRDGSDRRAGRGARCRDRRDRRRSSPARPNGLSPASRRTAGTSSKAKARCFIRPMPP
jgi:hypothetical protein